jgi:(Z)-2-((N-methylformamido)methylene)-5-hydroxybutyrolactone dehydrogenase
MQEMIERGEQVKKYKLYINGRWEDSSSGKTLQVVNPFTEKICAEVALADEFDINRAVVAAHEAFLNPSWREMSPGHRGQLIRNLGDLIKQDAERLSKIETMCNGKLLREIQAQFVAIPNNYYYYSGITDKIQGEVIPLENPEVLNYTIREPLGVVGIIIPWNSPILAMTEWLAAALATGNTAVVKPSEFTPVSALEMMPLFEEAGLPRGVVNVVPGLGEMAGHAIASHPLVAKISFTGGTETGREIVRDSAENLARLSLELGGKSPQIVFQDADLDAALNGVIAGIFAASGQSCVAGSRLFVHEDVYDEFVARLVERAKRIKIGDPMSPDTEMGPIATRDQLEKVKKYVAIGVQEGARVLCGGKQPPKEIVKSGYFYEPTILADVRNDMKICQDEIFGPVLAVMKFRDEDEVLKLANDTRYGLAAGIWTNDVQRVHRFARKLQAGTIWVNTYRALSHSSPFGGFKESGYGRQCGLEAIKEYTQVKSVWVDTSGQKLDPFSSRHR